MKRLMCAAMAGITALTSIVMTVPAAAEEKTNRYGDFEYKINGSEVAITKYVGDDSSVYIPDYIDGRKVTEIGEGAFALLDEHNEAIENEKLTHVRLPAYLESIGREAFYHTTSLESIVLPASLKEVGYFAFEGSGISELVIGSDLKLADNSFAECVNLSTVSLYPNTTWYTNYYTGTVVDLCPSLDLALAYAVFVQLLDVHLFCHTYHLSATSFSQGALPLS